MKKNKKKTISGFTLLEIIIVIFLMGIATSMVFINIGKEHKEKENKDFIKQVVSLCKKARLRAVNHGKKAVFQISSLKRECNIEDEETKISIPEDLLVEGEGVVMIEDGVYGFIFYPDGSTSGGELVFSALGEYLCNIKVDRLTGIIKKVINQ